MSLDLSTVSPRTAELTTLLSREARLFDQREYAAWLELLDDTKSDTAKAALEQVVKTSKSERLKASAQRVLAANFAAVMARIEPAFEHWG